jgi:hypothetical protein
VAALPVPIPWWTDAPTQTAAGIGDGARKWSVRTAASVSLFPRKARPRARISSIESGQASILIHHSWGRRAGMLWRIACEAGLIPSYSMSCLTLAYAASDSARALIDRPGTVGHEGPGPKPREPTHQSRTLHQNSMRSVRSAESISIFPSAFCATGPRSDTCTSCIPIGPVPD